MPSTMCLVLCIGSCRDAPFRLRVLGVCASGRASGIPVGCGANPTRMAHSGNSIPLLLCACKCASAACVQSEGESAVFVYALWHESDVRKLPSLRPLLQLLHAHHRHKHGSGREEEESEHSKDSGEAMGGVEATGDEE